MQTMRKVVEIIEKMKQIWFTCNTDSIFYVLQINSYTAHTAFQYNVFCNRSCIIGHSWATLNSLSELYSDTA